MIFASNFVYAELGWIVINCRFIICKGSALINRSCLKRGLRGELACQQILLAPNQRPHQSQNWHPPTPLHVPWLCFPNLLLRVPMPLLFIARPGNRQTGGDILGSFLLFVDFRATRHGHNCESGPRSSVSICSGQADDLLLTNQNVFGEISVFAQQKVFGD